MSLGLGLGNGNHFSGQGKQGQHGHHVGARTKRLERRHATVERDPNTQEPAGLATTWREKSRARKLTAVSTAASNVCSLFNPLVKSPEQSSGKFDPLVKLKDLNANVEPMGKLRIDETPAFKAECQSVIDELRRCLVSCNFDELDHLGNRLGYVLYVMSQRPDYSDVFDETGSDAVKKGGFQQMQLQGFLGKCFGPDAVNLFVEFVNFKGGENGGHYEATDADGHRIPNKGCFMDANGNPRDMGGDNYNFCGFIAIGQAFLHHMLASKGPLGGDEEGSDALSLGDINESNRLGLDNFLGQLETMVKAQDIPPVAADDQSNVKLTLSDRVAVCMQLDPELRNRLHELGLFSIKEELKDSFRFERELKWLVKKILEFMSFSNQWADVDASTLCDHDIKQLATDVLDTMDVLKRHVQLQADEQKATPGFVDKFQKGVNTMVKFGRTVLGKHPENPRMLFYLTFLALIRNVSTSGSGECVGGGAPGKLPAGDLVSPIQAGMYELLEAVRLFNMTNNPDLTNPRDAMFGSQPAQCVEQLDLDIPAVLSAAQIGTLKNYVAPSPSSECTEDQSEIVGQVYDHLQGIENKKDQGDAPNVPYTIRAEANVGDNQPSILIVDGNPYDVRILKDGRIGLVRNDVGQGILVGVFGNDDNLLYPAVGVDDSGGVTVQDSGLNVGFSLHLNVDGGVSSTVERYNPETLVSAIPGGGVEVCLDETTTATAAQTVPGTTHADSEIISPTPVPVDPTPVPLNPVLGHQLRIDVSVSSMTNTTVVGDGSDSAMWLQPANGEAVKAQIGPVFDTGTASEVSVYPYGPGFIDISNDEGLLYSNKNGRARYFSSLFDGVVLREGSYLRLNDRNFTDVEAFFDYAKENQVVGPGGLFNVTLTEKGEEGVLVLGQDDSGRLFLSQDGRPDVISGNPGLLGQDAAAWEASYQARHAQERDGQQDENSDWHEFCVGDDQGDNSLCKSKLQITSTFPVRVSPAEKKSGLDDESGGGDGLVFGSGSGSASGSGTGGGSGVDDGSGGSGTGGGSGVDDGSGGSGIGGAQELTMDQVDQD